MLYYQNQKKWNINLRQPMSPRVIGPHIGRNSWEDINLLSTQEIKCMFRYQRLSKSVASSLVEMSGILNLKDLTSFPVIRTNKEIKILDTGWLSLFENNKNITTISRREFDASKVATIRNMFCNIYFMSHLDMRGWNTSPLINTTKCLIAVKN